MKKLFAALLFAVPLFAQSALPPRDPITTEDLKAQIADCMINSRSESLYEAKLIARIRELEKQVADLKAEKAK